MGADKWAQVHDPAWYGVDAAARDAALAALPRVLVAPRPGFDVDGAEVLEVDDRPRATCRRPRRVPGAAPPRRARTPAAA